MSELKPCPFCGEKPGIDKEFWVLCNNCRCNSSSVAQEHAWNRRPIEDSLRRERDEAVRRASRDLSDLTSVLRKMRAKLNFYEDMLTIEGGGLWALQSGDVVKTVEPSRLGDLMAELSRLREEVALLRNVASDVGVWESLDPSWSDERSGGLDDIRRNAYLTAKWLANKSQLDALRAKRGDGGA